MGGLQSYLSPLDTDDLGSHSGFKCVSFLLYYASSLKGKELCSRPSIPLNRYINIGKNRRAMNEFNFLIRGISIYIASLKYKNFYLRFLFLERKYEKLTSLTGRNQFQ